MELTKAGLVLVAALAFASSPWWSPGFGGFDPDSFPNPQRDPPVQPAGYAFSIWGLIYLWLIVHGVMGRFARISDPDWAPSRWPLIVSLAIGTFWIWVAVTSPIWATVMIWAMLLAALTALFRVPEDDDRWTLQAPIAVYAGWLTGASFVSIGLLGAGYGVLMGQVGWAWTALLLALGFALAVQIRLARAPEYGAAVTWALVAIAVQNWGLGNLWLTVAAGGAAFLTAALAFRIARAF